MPVALPTAVAEKLAAFESSQRPLDAMALAVELDAVTGAVDALTADERKGCCAEIASLNFMVAAGQEREPWGLYFLPMTVITDAAGQPHYRPDIAWMDAEIIEYWKERSAACPHAALRARYADLAQEIGGFWNANHRDHPKIDRPRALTQCAASSYVDAVETGLAKDAYAAWNFLERALTLAAVIKDTSLVERVKQAAFAFRRTRTADDEIGLWWRLDDLMSRVKGVSWSEPERSEAMTLLRSNLASASDIAGQAFDPHKALAAADRLARWVDAADAQAALQTAGAAFEAMAAKADAMTATAWLEDLSRRYRKANLVNDANRVDAVIRSRAEEARAEMSSVSHTFEIPKHELEHWVQNVVTGDASSALSRIAAFFLSDPRRVEEEVKAIAAQAPLQAGLDISIVGSHGFTVAVIGSVSKDMPGRLIHQVADRIGMTSPLLNMMLTRARETYCLGIDAWMSYFSASPAFPPECHGLLKEGLLAWLAEDAIKAVHVLVPQVEAALREVLALMGESPMVPAKSGGGFETIGMGAVLNHQTFISRMPASVRLHFRALYTEPRGLNLRNKVAHGHASTSLLGMGMANWVMHSLMTIAALRTGGGSQPDAQPNPS